MAPNLASSKNELIYDMVRSGELSPKHMALGRWLRQEYHEHHLNKNAAFYDHMVPFSRLLQSPRVHFEAFLQALGMYVEAG